MYNTEKPISYWREVYLLHASTTSFKKKVEKAKDITKRFLDLGVKGYGSISGGKDSTAMMHLIHSLEPTYPFMSQKDDMDFPEEMEYMKLLEEKYNLNLTIISPKQDIWEIAKNTDFTEDIHSKGTSFSDDLFYNLLKEFQVENSYKGVFLGLRTEESKGRKINFAAKSHIYYNQDYSQLVCQPLALWTAKDVFAYLFSNDIPILDVYFKTRFVKSPENIRKSWVLPSAQSQSGQVQWLKHYYPSIYNRLAAINPRMRLYV